MKKRTLFVFIPIIWILTSCNIGENTIEEIAPAVLYFFEKGANEKYRVTTMVPPVKREKRTVITIEESLIKDIKSKLNSQYFRSIKDGQLRIVFFSKELAEESIEEIVTALYMDTDISDRVYLGIVEGDFKNLMISNSSTDYLLYRQMKHNQNKGEILVVDLHEFIKSIHSNYADPYLPFFSMVKGELHFNGLVLFKDYKLIHRFKLNEAKLFDFLTGQMNYHEVFSLQKLHLNLGLVNSDVKFQVNNEEKKIKISMKFRGIINEYQGFKDLTIEKKQLELKSDIQSDIKKSMEELIQTLQSNRVDPLKIGLYTKGVFSEPYKDGKWKDVWPEYNVELIVELDIKDYGTYQRRGSF